MSETNYLLFKLGQRTLAVGSGLTRQVVPVEQIYRLPGVAGGLLGLIPAGGVVLPLIDLAVIAGVESRQIELALVCEIAGEQLALPVEEVIGFMHEDAAPQTTSLLSEETLLGGYFGGGQKAQVINPQTLLRTLQEHLLTS